MWLLRTVHPLRAKQGYFNVVMWQHVELGWVFFLFFLFGACFSTMQHSFLKMTKDFCVSSIQFYFLEIKSRKLNG